MASLLPTTAMCSCRVLVRVMLVLCSAQLTALPAVQLHLADLESGSTLMEGGFPLWILFPLLLPSHSIETEVLHWFVWTEDPTRVCQWCTLECTAVKYRTKTMWSRHCVWEHILQRVQVSLDMCVMCACSSHYNSFQSPQLSVTLLTTPKDLWMERKQHWVWPLIFLIARHFQHTCKLGVSICSSSDWVGTIIWWIPQVA